MAPKDITGTGRARQRHDLLGVLRAERQLYDAAVRALQSWLPTVRDAVFGALVAAGTPPTPDPQGVYSAAAAWRTAMEQEMLPAVEDVMVRRLAEYLDATGVAGITPTDDPGASNMVGASREAIYRGADPSAAALAYSAPGIREWQHQYLQQVFNRLVRVPDTVFELVAKELDVSLALGEGPQVRATRIKTILDFTNSEVWPHRAITIARTEATGAYNQASVWAAKARSLEYDLPLRKAWLSAVDGRTRDSHFAADGQVVDLDGTFTVGGAQLEYPGDPRGPAKEVINCRCTILELPPGDPLPPELDRHTERDEGNATVRNRKGSQADEIKRRADDGIIRARDAATPTDAILAAGPLEENSMAQHWQGTLAPLGKPTGDDRIFANDATVAFREFPLPLMWQKQTAEGHALAYTVGSIRRAWVENGTIMGEGVLFDTPEAQEAIAQLGEGVTRPSVDLCDDEWAMVDENGQEVTEEQFWDAMEEGTDLKLLMQFTSFTVMAATLVAKPAFAEARIELTNGGQGEQEGNGEATVTEAEAGLVASAAKSDSPVYDTANFLDPRLTGPTALHMRDDGRIVGHLALWNDCHVGIGDACVIAPQTRTNYALFHLAEVLTEQGALAVGKLTVGGGHADSKLGVQPTVEHYDNAGTAFALVRAGEDEHGIWVSGVAAPWASVEQVQLGLSCPLSGDWRRHGGNLELVAALCVNTPGFPVPRGKRDSMGRDYALVAAGVVPPRMSAPDARLLHQIDATVREAVTAAMEGMAAASTLQARQQAMEQRVQRIREARIERELAPLARTRADIIRNRTLGKA